MCEKYYKNKVHWEYRCGMLASFDRRVQFDSIVSVQQEVAERASLDQAVGMVRSTDESWRQSQANSSTG